MKHTDITAVTESVDETVELGRRFGQCLVGGEVLEFYSDIGGGKTTFIKGLAHGMGLEGESVQSPTFIVGAVYEKPDGISLHHYDFYRLTDAGIMREQLAESLNQPLVVTAVEWSDIVKDVMPATAMRIAIRSDAKEAARRYFNFRFPEALKYVTKAIAK